MIIMNNHIIGIISIVLILLLLLYITICHWTLSAGPAKEQIQWYGW